jgi:hypothetical protein
VAAPRRHLRPDRPRSPGRSAETASHHERLIRNWNTARARRDRGPASCGAGGHRPGMPSSGTREAYLGRSRRIVEWLPGRARRRGRRPGMHSERHDYDYWHFVTVDRHPAWGGVRSRRDDPAPWMAAPADGGTWVRLLSSANLRRRGVSHAHCLRPGRAIAAVAALLTFPRLFAEAHFATLDGQLTAWWLLLWACRPQGPRWRGRQVWRPRRLTARPSSLAGWPDSAGHRASPRAIAAHARADDCDAGRRRFYLVDPPMWCHPMSRA